MKTDEHTLNEIKRLFSEYSDIANANLRTDHGRTTYTRHVAMFIRWIEGSFIPGENVKR